MMNGLTVSIKQIRKDSFCRCESVLCDFMNMTMHLKASVEAKGTRSSLGLKNSGSMVFIHQMRSVSVRELLSSQKNRGYFWRKKDWKLWQVSKLDILQRFDRPLKNLNINSAFSMDADFSGITDGIAFISGKTANLYLHRREWS